MPNWSAAFTAHMCVTRAGNSQKQVPHMPAVLLLQEFELPGIGSVGGFSGTRKSKEMFFSFTSEGTVQQ